MHLRLTVLDSLLLFRFLFILLYLVLLLVKILATKPWSFPLTADSSAQFLYFRPQASQCFLFACPPPAWHILPLALRSKYTQHLFSLQTLALNLLIH